MLPYKQQEIRLDQLEMPKVPMYYMQSDPDRAFPDSRYPHSGVALVRVDELLRNEVKIHPKAALAYKDWKANGENAEIIKQIDAVSLGHPDKVEYFRNKLAEGIARIASASWKKPVRVLLSDAPSNELDRLIGGMAEVDGTPISFRAEDRNPLLGIRGAARYTHLDYEDAFKLELEAVKRARGDMGMTHISLVLPACQTAKDVKAVSNLLGRAGLKRGEGGLEYHLLCRTPAQLMALDSFAADFDGFVIDVAELTQLMLGMDAGNVQVRTYYDDKHPAVIAYLEMALSAARKLKKPAGLVNIPPGALNHYAGQKATHKASYVAFRPEVYPTAREELILGQAKLK